MSSVPAACVSESCRCCCGGRSRDNATTVVVRRRRCVSKNDRMENHNVCINKSMPKMFAKKIYQEQRRTSRYCSQLYTFHIVRTRAPANMYTASAVRGTFIKTKDRFFFFPQTSLYFLFLLLILIFLLHPSYCSSSSPSNINTRSEIFRLNSRNNTSKFSRYLVQLATSWYLPMIGN